MEWIHIFTHIILFCAGVTTFCSIFLEETPWFARLLLLILSLSIFDVLFK